MRNIDVIEAFVTGVGPKKVGHLRIEGNKLYSYNTVVAMWVCGVMHIDSTKYSKTTTCHTNALLKILNERKIPHMEYPFYKRGE